MFLIDMSGNYWKKMLPTPLLIMCVSISITQAFQMIDLTYKYNNATIRWPADPKFNITIKRSYVRYPYQTEVYGSTSHAGTHMDAPRHFTLDKWTIDEIPSDRLVAPAAVIDVTRKVVINRDYLLQISDFENWERKTKQSLNNTIILLRTGFGKYYPNKLMYTGTSKDDVTKLHFPGISREAAQWLVDHRTPYGVGLDTMSLDNGPSTEFWAHRILLGANIYGLENVANLEKLPEWGAMLYVMPMKIEDAGGAPTRIFAVLPPTA